MLQIKLVLGVSCPGKGKKPAVLFLERVYKRLDKNLHDPSYLPRLFLAHTVALAFSSPSVEMNHVESSSFQLSSHFIAVQHTYFLLVRLI